MISIIIPCYNCEKTLKRAVESIIGQDYHSWEMVLVDDGSSDATAELCDEYSNNDNRIKVIHQTNTGLMRAWKNGVLASSGEYVTFCDADDYYDQGFLKHATNVVDQYSVDLYAYGLVLDYENDDSLVSSNLFTGLFLREQIKTEVMPKLFPVKYSGEWSILQTRVSKVYKKELLIRIIQDLPDYVSQGEDNLTVFAALLNAKSLYSECDYTPYHYVRNNESMIGKYDEKWYEKILLLRKELFTLAKSYGFNNMEALYVDFFFNTVTYAKKEIIRSDKSLKDIANSIRKVGDSLEFKESLKCISAFSLSPMIILFAKLIELKQYYLLCVITKIACKIGIGKP